MVAYLILIMLITILVVGGAYEWHSDFVDAVLSAINNYQGTQLYGQLDQDSINDGSLLLLLFKYSLMIFLPAIILWVYTLAQKPVKHF